MPFGEVRLITSSRLVDCLRTDALAHDFLRELRLGERHPVLHVDLGDVGVGADLERHLHVQVPSLPLVDAM